MARTYWDIYICESGTTYLPDGQINKPNENTSIDTTSTMVKVKLANGSNAYLIPETKYSVEPINFRWFLDDGTLKSKIETYIKNNDKVKIVTHTGENYIGYFVSIKRVWLVGISPDTYDLDVTFDRITGSD